MACTYTLTALSSPTTPHSGNAPNMNTRQIIRSNGGTVLCNRKTISRTFLASQELRISVEMAAFSVLLSIEKATISNEIRSNNGGLRMCAYTMLLHR